jgi:hypothetical protein
MAKSDDRIADIHRLMDDLAETKAQVERLKKERNDFASAVERLGTTLFGWDEWRSAKAPWWSDLSRLIQRHEAAEAGGGKNES